MPPTAHTKARRTPQGARRAQARTIMSGAARAAGRMHRGAASARAAGSRRAGYSAACEARSPPVRVASNRNQVRRSVSSTKFSRMLAVAMSSCLSANVVGLAHPVGDRLVVGHQLQQHVPRRHEWGVIVLDLLQLGDVSDRADGGAADLADALGEVVGGGEDLVRLFVEQQVVVAEFGAADVPMEILGLEIEREGVRQQPIERGRDRRDGFGRQIGGSVERGRDLARFELSDLRHVRYLVLGLAVLRLGGVSVRTRILKLRDGQMTSG